MNIPDFLVSTHKSLSIVENGKLRDIWRPQAGLIFGITWSTNYIYVLSRNGPGKRESIEIFDKSFNWKGSISPQEPDHIRGGHQIYYHPKLDTLFIMNSNQRCVSYIEHPDDVSNMPPNFIKHYKWPGATEATHINSFWHCGDSMYIVEHNGGDPPSNLVSFPEGFFDKPSYPPILGIGLHCHNIFVENYAMYPSLVTLSSMEYGIKEIDISNPDNGYGRLKRFQQIHALGLPRWYPRGLGRGEGCWVVGLSMHLEMAPNYWRQGEEVHARKRQERMNCQVGGAVVLDEDWNVIHEVPINNRGQIHDIRVVSKFDLAHNGVPF
jgi:hypothetical protein